MRNFIIFFMIFSCITLCFAQNPPEQNVQRKFPGFAELDKNQDGKITKDEWKGPEKFFERFDANGDGAITKEEFPQKNFKPQGDMQQNMPGEQKNPFMQMDKNKDQKISKEEYMAFFEMIDANKDGFLTMQEFMAYRQKGQNFRQEKPFRQEQGNMMDKKQRLQKMDKNKDGKISQEEWQGDPEMFNKLDRNQDGVIDKKEIQNILNRPHPPQEQDKPKPQEEPEENPEDEE